MAKPRQSRPAVGVPDVGGNNLPVIIGSVVVVLVIAIVAVLATRGSGDGEGAEEVDTIEWQPVTVAGTPLPPYKQSESAAPNEAAGSVAPELTGKNFVSEPVTIGNDGRAKAVVFLAHWCPHCQNELPKISDWLQGNRERYPNVDFYGVVTSTNNRSPNFPPSDWIAREGFTGKILVDDRRNTASSAYGLSGYPFMVFLDKNNMVVSRTSGEIGVEEFETRVRAASQA